MHCGVAQGAGGGAYLRDFVTARIKHDIENSAAQRLEAFVAVTSDVLSLGKHGGV